MVPLGTRRAALFLVGSVTLVYITVVLSGLTPTADHLRLQQDGPGHASAGLIPSRQGLLNLDVAIIVCYRDRATQLYIFINFMNSFLLSQNSSARIYIVEQDRGDEFNRAKLFNVGYAEAKKDYNYSCFIFHDIDLLPENPKLIYRCGRQPYHMSVSIDKYNYKLHYKTAFGGVSGLTEQQFKKLNGYPNAYWGWGGEDDDMSRRITKVGYKINHAPAKIARYTMLRSTGIHTTSKPNSARFDLLTKAEANMAKDGLSSLDYGVIKKVDYKTYIWILADLKRNGKSKSIPKRASIKKNNPPSMKETHLLLNFQGHRRYDLLAKAEANMAKDGLNSLDYEVIEKVDYKTYIWILADLKRNGNPSQDQREQAKRKKKLRRRKRHL